MINPNVETIIEMIMKELTNIDIRYIHEACTTVNYYSETIEKKKILRKYIKKIAENSNAYLDNNIDE